MRHNFIVFSGLQTLPQYNAAVYGAKLIVERLKASHWISCIVMAAFS